MKSAVSQPVARAFGASLRLLRQGRELSQEALAEVAGLDPTTPSLYERGKRQPTLAAVLMLAKALGIDPALLVRMTLARLQRDDTPGSIWRSTS